MDVTLKDGIPPGKTHAERMAIAREIAGQCLEKHGDAIAAVCVYGSTAVDRDLPYSDLDMTILTHVDLDDQTRCYTIRDLTINLDYQTVEDTIQSEAAVAGEGGCWKTILVLHDPDGIVDDLIARYEKLTDDDFTRRIADMMADDLPTYLGKMRNGVVADDRAEFLGPIHRFGTKVLKALCLLNRHYVTGERHLLPECRELDLLPRDFGERIDRVTGAVPAADQERYDAAEALWMEMKRLAAEGGIDWRCDRIGP